jgi:hypothetical protein
VDEAGSWGRGDLPPEQGGNLGFLRDDPEDPSLLVVVLLTDEDDCSVSSVEHLKPNNQLEEGSPFRAEDINLRCHLHPDRLHAVERYVKGLRALRPGREDLVLFTAIAGVPPDAVSPEVLAATDFADGAARDQFYDTILAHPRMQNEIDPATNPGMGQGNVKPACERQDPTETQPSVAYPARRIVQLAKAFGANSMVQSICTDDFGPAIDMLVSSMARPLGEMCMQQNLTRDVAGLVDCALYWELPAPGAQLDATTPTNCAALGGLALPSDAAAGGQRCAIRQLAVHDGVPESGEGWYYDDFTSGLGSMCSAGLTRRIAFTDQAYPARGVAAKLECRAGAASVD